MWNAPGRVTRMKIWGRALALNGLYLVHRLSIPLFPDSTQLGNIFLKEHSYSNCTLMIYLWNLRSVLIVCCKISVIVSDINNITYKISDIVSNINFSLFLRDETIFFQKFVFITKCFTNKNVFFSPLKEIMIDKLKWQVYIRNIHVMGFLFTLESGIDVAPWINVASGKFDKKNKRSPLKCANVYSKI